MLEPVLAPDALLVSDANRCYPPVAAALDIRHESINASAGERVRGAVHIQAVNSRHSRIKGFLRGFRSIATKYLDSYLRWFHLVELGEQPLPRARLKAATAKPCLQLLTEPMRTFAYTGLLLFFLCAVSMGYAQDAGAESYGDDGIPDSSTPCQTGGMSHGGLTREYWASSFEDEMAVNGQFQKLARTRDDAALGMDSAEVRLVAFIDYACPYCRGMATDMLALSAQYPYVQIVFKEFPILGEASDKAARASLAAAKQDGWSVFYAALMNSIPGLSIDEAIDMAAGEADLDLDRFRSDSNDPAAISAIERNRALAEALAIDSTPSLVIGRRIIRGAVSLDCLTHLVERHPDSPHDYGDNAAAWMARGQRILDESGLFSSVEAAIDAFNTAIRLDPEKAGYYGALGSALWRENHHSQAAQAFTDAIEREDDAMALARHYDSRGSLLCNIIASDCVEDSACTEDIGSLLERGRTDFDRAIALNPENPDFHVDRARCLAYIDEWTGEAKHLDNIMEDYNTAIDLAHEQYPEYLDGYLQYSVGEWAKRGNYDRWFESLVKMENPDIYDIWETLERIDDRDRREELFEQVVSILKAQFVICMHCDRIVSGFPLGSERWITSAFGSGFRVSTS